MGVLAAALNRFGDLKGAHFFVLQVVCYLVISLPNDGMAPSRKRGCLGESDEQATKLTPSAAGGALTISASENAMHNLNGFFGCRLKPLWGFKGRPFFSVAGGLLPRYFSSKRRHGTFAQARLPRRE